MMKNRLRGKRALITGATSGIGKSVAYQLAELGVDLILTGRRETRLNELKSQLVNSFEISVETACFDIRDREACIECHQQIKHLKPDILVNNAGLASGTDAVQNASFEDWDLMLDTNLRGLLTITRLFLPEMLERNSGHIVNVSSVAGHEPYPGGSVYCATKHAVDAFTRALKMDIGHSKIRVSLVSPGAVETEFSVVRFKGDTDRAASVYAGITPLIADDIAEIIVFILNRPDHVNILDTLVFSTAQSSATRIHREI
jgi:3-hydroxy acid dehydrogenase / malonic semialdehyde reductase